MIILVCGLSVICYVHLSATNKISFINNYFVKLYETWKGYSLQEAVLVWLKQLGYSRNLVTIAAKRKKNPTSSKPMAKSFDFWHVSLSSRVYTSLKSVEITQKELCQRCHDVSI